MNAEKTGTEEIKGTDFVEPQGKGRKIIGWILKGLALAASAVIGGLIGHAIGGKNDDKDSDESTAETDESEKTE